MALAKPSLHCKSLHFSLEFPGPSFDELFECLTLVQCGKIKKHLPIVLYGDEFWKKVVDLDALVEFGTISPEDVKLCHRSDSVDEAFDYITTQLTEHSIDRPGLGL